MNPNEAQAEIRKVFPEYFARQDSTLDDDAHYVSGWYNALRGFSHTDDDYSNSPAGLMGYWDCVGGNDELD